jgi:YcxB-like protein
MVAIRYSLTPEDLAELKAGRRGGLLSRILRIPAAVLIGLIGLAMAWPAIFVFPWHPWDHWFGNLAIAAVGLFMLWVSLDMPGVRWLSQRLSDPRAESELQVYEGGIVCSCRGKIHYLRLRPQRSFRENRKFFFLRALDTEFAIPKHAVTPEQEKKLRELVQPVALPQESVRGDAIECSFFLAQDELNEALAARHRSFLERWLSTKYGRLFGRAICVLTALGILGLPILMGKSWAEEFRNEPGVAVGLVGFGLFYLFAAAGCPGLRALNRLDLPRRIRISDRQVAVSRGTKTSTYSWKRFFSYQETQNLFVLRTQIVVKFWTIPKRALQPGDEEKLRALLDRKLPKQ